MNTLVHSLIAVAAVPGGVVTGGAVAGGACVLLHNAADANVSMPVAGLGTDFSGCENASESGNHSFAASLLWLQLGGATELCTAATASFCSQMLLNPWFGQHFA